MEYYYGLWTRFYLIMFPMAPQAKIFSLVLSFEQKYVQNMILSTYNNSLWSCVGSELKYSILVSARASEQFLREQFSRSSAQANNFEQLFAV